MRLRVAPPPPPEVLTRLTPHEVVRDHPESLAVFRGAGVDLRVDGARPLRVVLLDRGEEGERLLRELSRALEWRAR